MLKRGAARCLCERLLFLVFFVGVFVGVEFIIAADLAYAAGASQTQTKKLRRKYRHPCPEGTEKFGAPPPLGTKIYCRQPMRNGMKKHGAFVSWFQNGQKKMEGEYHHDAKNGDWTYYHRNGKEKYSEKWNNGQRISRIRIDRSGKPVIEPDRRLLRKKRREAESWRYGRSKSVKPRKRRKKRRSSWVKRGTRSRGRNVLR